MTKFLLYPFVAVIDSFAFGHNQYSCLVLTSSSGVLQLLFFNSVSGEENVIQLNFT